jgi:hypothetical protein
MSKLKIKSYTMKTLRIGIVILFATFFATSCKDEEIAKQSCRGEAATVRDLRSLDGCGYVFELANGTRLEPYRVFMCGTPPLPKEVIEDPLLNFAFEDGKHVVIGYEEIPNAVSICMVGKVVKITCLKEAEVIISEK